MKTETQKWLREAIEHQAEIAHALTSNGSLSIGQVDTLSKQVYEFAIKAPIVEKSTGVPREYHSHSLTDLCRQYGLWGELPKNLQTAITEMDQFYPAYPGSVAYQTHASSSSPEQWRHRIEMGGELIDFVQKAIDDRTRFSKFKF